MAKPYGEFTPSVVDAVHHLKTRYAEISVKFPDFARKIPEAQYVSVNLKAALRNQDPRPHASDCGHWSMERCDCVVGKDVL